MAGSEVELGFGIRALMRGSECDEAEAASQLLAETVRWWRAIARTKLRIAEPTPDDGTGRTDAERAYYARKGGT